MPETAPERAVPMVLVDGPDAGLLVDAGPGIAQWYQRDETPSPSVFNPAATATTWLPKYTVYQVRQIPVRLSTAYDPGWTEIGIRIGWCTPGEPDTVAVRRHVRAALLEHPDLIPPGARVWDEDEPYDEPIRILDPGQGPSPMCRDLFEMDPVTGLMHGTCPCGWRTEAVPPRRFGELRALTFEHGQGGILAVEALIREGMVTRELFMASLAALDPANRRRADDASALEWGAPLEDSDANWPDEDSNVCAHVCGGDADHACDVRAATRLTYDLPSGGTRTMPICHPCRNAEWAAGQRYQLVAEDEMVRLECKECPETLLHIASPTEVAHDAVHDACAEHDRLKHSSGEEALQ